MILPLTVAGISRLMAIAPTFPPNDTSSKAAISSSGYFWQRLSKHRRRSLETKFKSVNSEAK
jgi:hypothetical protein